MDLTHVIESSHAVMTTTTFAEGRHLGLLSANGRHINPLNTTMLVEGRHACLLSAGRHINPLNMWAFLAELMVMMMMGPTVVMERVASVLTMAPARTYVLPLAVICN